MIPDVILIAKTKVDFDTFLTGSKEILGYKLDISGNTSVDYLAGLAKIKRQKLDMDNPGYLLNHLHYTLLVACDKADAEALLEQSDLNVIVQQGTVATLMIVSGNLQQWKTAVVNNCSDNASFNLRLLFDKVWLIFDSEGLSKIWQHYRKVPMPDKTFKLLERK